MKIREVSAAVFYNCENEILLQKRGSYSKYGEEYAFFGGGKEWDETPEETLIREIKEELWLEISNFRYEFLGSFRAEFPERNLIAIRSIFVIPTQKKAEDFTVLEGEGAEYFSLEDAKKQSLPNPMPETFEVLWKYFKTLKS